MSPKLADYIAEGKSLDAQERLEAAHQLLLSVDLGTDADQDKIDEEWDQVIDRRVDEIVDDSANLVDGRAAHARVRAEIAALRK